MRPLTKRRSKRSKKALQFSYADLESGLVMRRKDSAEFSGEKEQDPATMITVPRSLGACT